MFYVFIDVAKSNKIKNIPYEYAKVGLMVSMKQAKKLTTPDEPHAVYVLPKRKATMSIVQAVWEVLVAHPDAKIALVSPRKRVQEAMAELSTHFAQAEIALFRKNGKKLNAFLTRDHAMKHSQTPELSACDEANEGAENPLSDTQNDENTVQNEDTSAQDATQTLEQSAPPESHLPADLAATLHALKKNRPKKKQDLWRFLRDIHHGDEEKVAEIGAILLEQQHIHIDAAENVRYGE